MHISRNAECFTKSSFKKRNFKKNCSTEIVFNYGKKRKGRGDSGTRSNDNYQ